jgi:GT2 family glycosyltransferase
MEIITICILHFNKLEKLQRTVRSIQENTSQDYVLRILNQGYLDRDIEKYLRYLGNMNNIQVMWGKTNLGPAAGRHYLFQDLRTDYVLSLDDDIYLPPDWFDPIIEFMSHHDNYKIVGLSLICPDRTPIPTAHYIKYKNDRTLVVYESVLPDAIEKIEENYYRADFVSEGAMVLKRNVLDKIYWDPKLSVCFEGLDLGLQMRDCNLQAAIYTGTKAVHDSISRSSAYRSYNEERRNYEKIGADYLYITGKWSVRFAYPKHVFYKYGCRLLPNRALRFLALIWLNWIKPLTTTTKSVFV